MEKRWVIFLSLIIFSGSVLGISSDLKSEYERSETIIAEIGGNILDPIDKDQIDFRRGHVSVPFDYDLQRLGEKYYLWAITPDNEANYTLVIKGVVTTVSGNIAEVDFEQDFIVRGNISDYSIDPGFFYSSGEFSVDITLNDDFDETISVNFPEEKEILLNPGKNEIDFSVLGVEKNILLEAMIGKYVVPVYIFSSGNESGVPSEIGDPTLRLNPGSISSTVLAGGQLEYPLSIVNFGMKSLSGVELVYNESLFSIDLREGIDIEPTSAVTINVEVIAEVSDELIESGIDEIIFIIVDDFSLELPIRIDFTSNESNVETPYLDEDAPLYYCSEIEGELCITGEICEGETQETIDGSCCVGACSIEDPGVSKVWIGWILVGVIIIVIIFAFWRYGKVKKKKEGFKERIKSAEGRIP
jgi:hypothetical protein